MNRRSPPDRFLRMVAPRPVAVAVLALLHGLVLAQPMGATDGARGLFEAGSPLPGSARPTNSFLERLGSSVDRISVRVLGDNLAADGLSATEVQVQLLDGKGQAVREDVEITIEVDGGARILLPGRQNPEGGASAGDMHRVEPGFQAMARAGSLQFRLVAPYQPETVRLRVSVRGSSETVLVRYVPDLREMIAVGLIEGHLRSDRFDPNQIVPVRQDDAFENELRNFNREFNGGKTRLGGRAAMYLKGKILGQYLLTLSYDSEKANERRLFNEIDPNTFYPVYGDSSIRGVDAQSSSKLYVRLDKGRSHLMYGDYTTTDQNPARSLGQYSRSLPGVRAHYEEGAVTANAFIARESLAQVVDEFPARGVSGPYSVSRSGGIVGSEKIEILVRDRNQLSIILKTTALTRFIDYEFEPFNGQILFRAPVPSVDDQLNPVSIRVTYEVDQGGKKFTVAGGDVALKLSEKLTLGISAAKDSNPEAPFTVLGANLHLRLSRSTEVIAEIARADSVVGTSAGNFTVNNSNNFRGVTGPVSGNAARAEIRHSSDALRARAYAARTDDNFNNNSAGMTGGRTEAGLSGVYQASSTIALNAEVLHSRDRIADTTSNAVSAGADLKLSDRLTIGAGARQVTQSAASLVSSIGSSCLGGGSGNTPGYNVGYGISQVGNQQIDPATGWPVACNPSLTGADGPGGSLDTKSIYARATWRATDTVSLTGEIQRELGDAANTLYRVGADWQVADKTRVYARYELARQYTGAYGLGVGEIDNNIAVGIDTQYMQDGAVYSEYRLRDASAGREVQAALGLRNGWRLAEGLRMITNIEKLNTTRGDSTAVAVGLEYTASDLWKASGRVEWRQDPTNTNHLATLGVARKLDSNWTVLARDYFNFVKSRETGLGRKQNQFQLGFAWRPVDSNKLDALALYERKTDTDDTALVRSKTDIVSVRANYHPSRPWWISGRYAFKRVDELLLGTVQDNYHAQLFGARLTYDVTNRWSVGGIATTLVGKGGGRQYAYGVEAGYVLMDNVWVTLGYNFRGFSDDELAGSNYTNRGWVLGVRYKFDEDLFRKGN